jgi:predicted nucleic acid-binding protein
LSEKSSGILADTSVWIEFFKQRSGTGDALEALILEDAVWTCGVVLFELAQGVRSDVEKAQVLTTVSHLKYAEMSKALWQKAGDLSTALLKKGLTIPLSDIFIAVIAIEHNLSLFTLDGHFEQKIASIRAQRLRGSRAARVWRVRIHAAYCQNRRVGCLL